MSEPSTKPYLIRAIYEWCTDSGYTPFLAVHVDGTTRVPQEFVKNNEIVLNISALATSKLQIGNDLVEFQARFGGKARTISVPIANVSAIYARENGHGMAFDLADAAIGRGHEPPALPAPMLPAPPEADTQPERESSSARDVLKVVQPDDHPPPPTDGPKGKPRLTIVK
jgi:stringent starvation protein B